MSSYKNRIAIAYDFDGTLAPGNMQEHNFIPDLNMDKADFWHEANQMAGTNDMDEVLAYMYLMLEKAKAKNIPIKEKTFVDYGKTIALFNGLDEYFERINRYVENRGFQLEHHIISSGLREFIKGTSIACHFRNIFASGFLYDAQGVACWPALAVNYTNKTQFLFRINKGISNSYDNTLINKVVPENKKPVPFSNIIYLGDGETDVPAMKMVKLYGGTTIAVYNPSPVRLAGKVRPSKTLCRGIVEAGRADYLAPADYSETGELYRHLCFAIDKIVAEQSLNLLKDKQLEE
ncbi:MAG: haloacid dehalogenase-like hydrolase [Bacteroidales bacterium]|jgi:2-hydroxy-3-keto-5-methylthiopentenyl-1-phosphate phosphatase|nr:haloacid dehalogenase-like hydrolase [Bacteroidales bacterium]